MAHSARSLAQDPRARGGALVFLALLAFLPAVGGDYLWDDTEYVLHNRHLDSAAGLARIWLAPGATPQYYPLTFTSFWVEVQLWGRAPAAHHLVNILLHGLAAVLLWRLLWRLEVRAAWTAAALFAVHPVGVESVAWITERKNVLSLALALAAALLYLRYARLGRSSCPEGERIAENSYLPATLLFLAALLAKTAVAPLPVALLCLALWKRGAAALREDAIPLLPFVALGAATGLTTAWMERVHVGAAGADWSLSTAGRFLVAGRAAWFYAGKLLLPWDLAFIYPRWTIDPADLWQAVYPASVAAVVAGLWVLRRRIGAGPLVATVIYLVMLFPALGFVDVYPMRFSFVADHFQYAACAALIAVAAAGAGAAAERLRLSPGWRRGATALLLAALAAATWARAGAYRDSETLWRDTLERNPGAWIAHVNLAEILVARGELDEAIGHCRRALELRPDLPEAHGNLANALFLRGDPQGALTHYQFILDRDPMNPQARNNLGAVLESQGRLEEAGDQFRQVTVVAPEFAEGYFNLANLLLKLERRDEAAAHLQRALRIDPGHYRARMRLADLRFAGGAVAEAEALLRAAESQAQRAGDTRALAEAEARWRFYRAPPREEAAGSSVR